MPGVAFAEVDKLSSVTLFEMSYTKWGIKPCCLCQDQRFARTGVAVGCDAGLCRTYFHVTWLVLLFAFTNSEFLVRNTI
jgi:disulfide bond formation protein DsbB